jgi:predicted kinase
VYQKLQKILDDPRPKIVFMGGLPGAGKSTTAKRFEEAGYLIACADTYRGVLSKRRYPDRKDWTDAMHESDQSLSGDAWGMVHQNARRAIEDGQSVVIDGLLHTAKARRRLFAQFNKLKVPYYAVYLDVTIKTAITRNSNRMAQGGRGVPQFVIEDKWRTQVLPSTREGFEDVVIINNDLIVNESITQEFRDTFIDRLTKEPRAYINELYVLGDLPSLLPSFYQGWGISQDNKNHNLAIAEHMITAVEKIEKRDPVSVVSMFLHDVGKAFTKEFFVKITKENDHNFKVGDKYVVIKSLQNGYTVKLKSFREGEGLAFVPYDVVEFDENAHFYDHEKVGAILARRDLLALGFDEEFANEVYTYILYHMELPFVPGSNKSMGKLIRKVGKEKLERLLAMRKADKLSGATKPNFLEVHEKMTEQVNDLINRGG